MLFQTQHGSHLYNLAHEGSDRDFYTVINTKRNRRAKYAKQSISDGVDSMVVDFGTWTNMLQAGVPQALEACFAPEWAVVVDTIPDFRHSLRVYGGGVIDRYMRTIDNFLAEDNFKKNRHALRLAMNLSTLLRHGRFNPALDPGQALHVNLWASQGPVAAREEAMRLVAS